MVHVWQGILNPRGQQIYSCGERKKNMVHTEYKWLFFAGKSTGFKADQKSKCRAW